MNGIQKNYRVEQLLQILTQNTSLLSNYIQLARNTNFSYLSIEESMANFNAMLALSGGGDSVGLLSLYAMLKTKYPTMCITAGYVNHKIQSTENQQREREVIERLCSRLDIELFCADSQGAATRIQKSTQKITQETSKADNSTSIANEIQARTFRYKELIKLARKTEQNCIITAHHSNDQLETVIMRLFQGQGIKGLSAIPSIRMLEDDSFLYVMRPCLYSAEIQKNVVASMDRVPQALRVAYSDISSEDLHYVAKWADMPVHTDPSNIVSAEKNSDNKQDTILAANKRVANKRAEIRASISPALQSVFPNALSKTADIARDFAQLAADTRVLANQHLWAIDAFNCGLNTRLSMSAKRFLAQSYTIKKELLLIALNKFGVANVSTKFLEQILDTSARNIEDKNFPLLFYIHTICIKISQHHILVFDNASHEDNNIYAEYTPVHAPVTLVPLFADSKDYLLSKLNMQHRNFNSKNRLRLEMYTANSIENILGLKYDIFVKGDACVDFANKHDSIIRQNKKANIRAILIAQLGFEDWKLVPIVRDSEGVVAVFGEVYASATIIRDNAMLTNKHKNPLNLPNTTLAKETCLSIYVSHECIAILKS